MRKFWTCERVSNKDTTFSDQKTPKSIPICLVPTVSEDITSFSWKYHKYSNILNLKPVKSLRVNSKYFNMKILPMKIMQSPEIFKCFAPLFLSI